jgi:hypothetical protein
MPRPTILTHAALARVVTLVDHGRSAAQIADEIGCTLGTLRVRCSQLGISLRRRRGTELKVLLPQVTTEQLQQRGALRGISSSTLAAELLMTIACDGLYDAVLDGR